ncbi:hypothetical protein Pmani_031480 [Petrolisthes manimaculis]|uniref:Uncharacterized protein n=1 Tax=Petrolisthes manimaculis TaxID=1843537 RepID=A0AAE1NVT5_9EUCA|nr:hypothetical protein Pmani_031480 [Petrolisthes manimaculis]
MVEERVERWWRKEWRDGGEKEERWWRKGGEMERKGGGKGGEKEGEKRGKGGGKEGGAGGGTKPLNWVVRHMAPPRPVNAQPISSLQLVLASDPITAQPIR